MIYKIVIVYRIYDENNPSKNPLALSSWPLALGSSNGKGKVFQPLICADDADQAHFFGRVLRCYIAENKAVIREQIATGQMAISDSKSKGQLLATSCWLLAQATATPKTKSKTVTYR